VRCRTPRTNSAEHLGPSGVNSYSVFGPGRSVYSGRRNGSSKPGIFSGATLLTCKECKQRAVSRSTAETNSRCSLRAPGSLMAPAPGEPSRSTQPGHGSPLPKAGPTATPAHTHGEAVHPTHLCGRTTLRPPRGGLTRTLPHKEGNTSAHRLSQEVGQSGSNKPSGGTSRERWLPAPAATTSAHNIHILDLLTKPGHY